ncbi:hypothetical protein BKG77_10285 [Mycobacteroides chelonae]|uniref:C40 family peptidase n=1 Tax=Mycobacteroides chelonae TaxID=1774 RepID=UPI0008A9F1F5|nr:NlpC/P60 family protein [Mycobacteroides chelonae]OHU23946.1 hypothetical protein BKG77_10285 [Mycobacteroides chelonae]
MAKIGDIRHWNPDTLQQVFDTATARAKSLTHLGEGIEQVANDLNTWGGATADAWRESMGKVRVDLGNHTEQAEKVAAAVKPAIDDVRDVKNKLGFLEQDAQSFGAQITDDGKVVAARQVKDTEKHLQDDQIARLQKQVTALEQRATTVEQEIAAALRAAVAGSPAAPQTSPLRDVGSQERPGVTDINDPGVKWDPNIDPAKWKESYQNPQLADNPPGKTLPAGAERDAAWKDYLANYPKDGTRGVLPNPDAVQDKGLKNLGFAASQLGTSYAWSGGNTKGPGKGDYEYDQNTGKPILNDSSRAFTYDDPNRIGFDCSGLTEYSAAQVNGGQSIGTYTGNQLTNQSLIPVEGTPQPGDMVYYGSGAAHHVAIYVAPGVVVEAPQSGEPVRLFMKPTDQAGAGELVRVRRLP